MCVCVRPTTSEGSVYSQQTQGVGSRHGLAVPHQEAAVAPGPSQQVLRQHAADVPVIPRCCCHGDSTPGYVPPHTPRSVWSPSRHWSDRSQSGRVIQECDGKIKNARVTHGPSTHTSLMVSLPTARGHLYAFCVRARVRERTVSSSQLHQSRRQKSLKKKSLAETRCRHSQVLQG